MTAPRTYAEWSVLLDELKNGTDDAEVLDAMKGGTLAWQSGVAERFAKKLTDAVNTRMNRASDRFSREMSRPGNGEGNIVRALLALRREMSFLKQVMDLPVIPEKDRAQYCQLVQAQADSMQKSLEDSAKRDRSGKLASIIRNHRVNTL